MGTALLSRAAGVLVLVVVVAAAAAAPRCDLFQGRWAADESYPLYDASRCPFVPDVFDCRRNGRPDAAYLNLRWFPSSCRLPRWVAMASLAAVERATSIADTDHTDTLRMFFSAGLMGWSCCGGGEGRRCCSWVTR